MKQDVAVGDEEMVRSRDGSSGRNRRAAMRVWKRENRQL